MERELECEFAEDQFGFRKKVGTREAMLTLRFIMEDRIWISRSTFTGFVDLKKIYDNAYCNKLLRILEMEYRERRVIYKKKENNYCKIIIQ